MQSMIPRGGPADNAPGVHNQDDGPVLTQWIQPTFARPDVADLSSPFLIEAIHSRDHALHDPAGQWIAAFFKTSLLSYKLGSSCAKLEPLPVRLFMTCRGGGRIGSLLVVMDR